MKVAKAINVALAFFHYFHRLFLLFKNRAKLFWKTFFSFLGYNYFSVGCDFNIWMFEGVCVMVVKFEMANNVFRVIGVVKQKNLPFSNIYTLLMIEKWTVLFYDATFNFVGVYYNSVDVKLRAQQIDRWDGKSTKRSNCRGDTFH